MGNSSTTGVWQSGTPVTLEYGFFPYKRCTAGFEDALTLTRKINRKNLACSNASSDEVVHSARTCDQHHVWYLGKNHNF
jgi:hypothetical protein